MKIVSVHINTFFKRAIRFILSLWVSVIFINEGLAQNSIDFTSSVDEGCIPLIVSFENVSSFDSTNATVNWNFGNGNQSSEKLFTQAVYTTPGDYTVTLTITQNGKKFTQSHLIKAYGNPKANFYADIRSGCVPLSVNFKDSSIATQNKIIHWTWNFGDGTGSNQQNVTKKFTSDKANNITLIVEDEKGCRDFIVKQTYIKSTEKPDIDFTYSDTIACNLPFSLNLNSVAQSNYTLQYKWSIGNGVISTDKNTKTTVSKVGILPVKLEVTNEYGCKNQIEKNITILSKPFDVNIISNNEKGCTPFNYNFRASSNIPIAEYKWTINNQSFSDTSGSILLDKSGEYTIQLTAMSASGCKRVVTKKITVQDKPKADLSMDANQACVAPLIVNFQSKTPDAVKHLWLFSGGVPSQTIANPTVVFGDGQYDVKYIATNLAGCSDTLYLKDTIKVKQASVSIIPTNESGCVPFSSMFTVFKDGVGDISNIKWFFPDGTVKSSLSPQNYHFTNEGNFEIRAEVDFKGSCPSQTVSTTIRAGSKVPINAVFSPKEVCVKEGVVGTVNTPDTHTIYTWKFGDGSKIEGASANHEYSDPAKYEVTVVADRFGCKDSMKVANVNVLNPSANFQVLKLCDNGEYRFINRSVGESYNKWDFGDGTISESNIKDFVHTFPKIGKYKVKLYVENNTTKCRDSMEVTIDYKVETNNIQFSQRAGCAPFTTSFNIDASIYKNATWTFQDTILSGLKISKTYTNPGNYDFKLKVLRKDGCTESYDFPKIVSVSDVKANFGFDPVGGCAPITVHLTDSSSSNLSKIVTRKWIFSGNGESSDMAPVMTFNKQEDVQVDLIVKTDKGCLDTTTKTIPIYFPKADFSSLLNSICTDKEIELTNNSHAVAPQYFWILGDSSQQSNAINPKVTFEKEGVYDVSLVVEDANHCRDSIIKKDIIKVENFKYDFEGAPRFKSCPELVSTFQLLPNNINYNYANWDFGNGNKSLDTNKTPVNIYSKSGLFDVKVALEDYRGCRDTIIKPKFIEVKGPRGEFTFTPNQGCLPLDIGFKVNFVDSKTNFWDFGNGVGVLDDQLKDTMNFTYTEPGRIIPSLILDDGKGCKVQLKYDTILVSGAHVVIDATQTNTCNDAVLDFKNITTSNEFAPVISSLWTINQKDQLTGDDINYLFHVDTTTGVWVKLQVETTLGCKDEDSIQVQVFSYPKIELPDSLTVCRADTVHLKAKGATHYEWLSERLILNQDSSGSITIRPIEDSWYHVVGYDTAMCKSYDSVRVKVREDFEAFAEPDTLLCQGSSVLLRSGVSGVQSGKFLYSWLKNSDTLSHSANLLVTPQSDAVYVINIKNGLCKEVNLPVYVKVSPLPNLLVYQDTTIALGTSVQLHAISEPKVNYSWTPDYEISCTDCPNPEVSPKKTTTYRINVTNSAGCSNDSSAIVTVVDMCSDARLKIPNVFSPNNDGLNDIFKIKYDKTLLKAKTLRIYNRFGELLFETNEPDTGWDGLYNGSPVNSGVYVYYFETICESGKSSIVRGNITLLR